MRIERPDVELPGILEGSTPKSYKFFADFGPEEMLFIPHSQSEWLPDLDSDTGRGIMRVRGWLADKNGWDRI